MKSVISYLIIGMLKLYQLMLSPALHVLGIRCRYDPGCSNYAVEAIRKHGAWAGLWMTAARLLRCHPIEWLNGSSGVDNVPESITKPPFWAPWRYGVWRHKNEE